MRVVVFGGAGFLGSHVADALTARGHDVAIFDLRPSPYLDPRQTMIVGDIGDAAAVRAALAGADVAYHFAGLADLDDASTKPLDTIRRNILGTATVLDAAVETRLKRFIYASTIYVYSTLGGFYRCSKQAGELYVEEYQRHYGLDYTILRYGSLYGPRADERNSLFRYLRQALTTGRIQYGGSQADIREYIHVRDAARLSAEVLDEEYRGRHIIISGQQTTRAADLLRMIDEIVQGGVKIEFAETPNAAHYTATPYSFTPKVGEKLVGRTYVDMGQGLLECLHEIHSQESGGATRAEK